MEEYQNSSGTNNPLIMIYNSNTTILNASVTPPVFCQTTLKLTAFLMQALGQVYKFIFLNLFLVYILIRTCL